MKTKKNQTTIRLEEKVLVKITFISKKEKRSLNSQIEFMIQELIEKYEKENGEIIVDSE